MSVPNILSRIAYYSAGLGLAASVTQSCYYIVDGGERAVLFDRLRGVLPSVAGEGLNFIIPILQKPYVFDIRTKPRSISSVTGTKDLQMVNLTLRLLYKPDVERLPWLYQTYGLDYDDKVLPSIGNEVLKAVVAQYNADQLLTQRDAVSKRLRAELNQRANDFSILLDDVAITHLSFGAEFAKAIETKQVAYQEAERAKFLVQKADQEKKAAIVRAEGESEAAKMISDATAAAGNGLIELRRIEASKDIASTLSKTKNVIYLPNNGNMLLGVNAGQ